MSKVVQIKKLTMLFVSPAYWITKVKVLTTLCECKVLIHLIGGSTHLTIK